MNQRGWTIDYQFKYIVNPLLDQKIPFEKVCPEFLADTLNKVMVAKEAIIEIAVRMDEMEQMGVVVPSDDKGFQKCKHIITDVLKYIGK